MLTLPPKRPRSPFQWPHSIARNPALDYIKADQQRSRELDVEAQRLHLPGYYISSIKMLQLPYNLLRDFCALVNERYVGDC